MRNLLFIGLYFFLSLKEVFTESENEIKTGVYPYMAIVYYPDESIVESTGTRFSRSAVLIRPEWLISSSLETNDTKLMFPHKTLLARAGAIRIDAHFTFNEDEDEQEREIIQIIRPTNFTTSPWWYNDITLLKTLLPFNMTAAVSTTMLAAKRDYMEKTCYIVVFARKSSNLSEEKTLMQLPVELLPSSSENCGVHYRKETMICASDSDESKNFAYDPNFCHGNSGGPLLCEGEVIGLQTYVGNSCKQPYLYLSVSMWDDFILCGVEEKFLIQQCLNICEVIEKDIVEKDIAVSTTMEIATSTTQTIKIVATNQSNENTSDEEYIPSPEAMKEKVTATNDNNKPTLTTKTTKTELSTKNKQELTTAAITENEEKATNVIDSEASWPKERPVEHRKKLDEAEDSDKLERKTNVEAQRHDVKKKGRNASHNLVPRLGLLNYLSFVVLCFSCMLYVAK